MGKVIGMRTRTFVLAIVAALLVAACSGDEGEDTTTTISGTTIPATTTTADSGPGGSGSTIPDDGPTTTLNPGDPPEATFPEYEIRRRITGDASGDTVIVLLKAGTYTDLSDLDLRGVVTDVVEEYAPILEAHVVDSEEAVDLVLLEAPTSAEQTILDEHYFVRLEEGFRIVFLGRFSDAGEQYLGS